MASVAWASESGFGWSVGGSLGPVPFASSVGVSSTENRFVAAADHGFVLLVALDRIGHVDLDGRGTAWHDDYETLGSLGDNGLLSRLFYVGGNDQVRNTLAMIEKEFTVKNRLGLHARPAALFVQTTTKFKSSIKVRRYEQEVDGKSIMGLMMLAAEEGAKLTIRADGADEAGAIAALDKLFTDRFNEND